jgi:hypothetical protein
VPDVRCTFRFKARESDVLRTVGIRATNADSVLRIC